MISLLLQGLLWMDLALLAAIIVILLRRLRFAPLAYGSIYLLLLESYLAHWLIYAIPPAGLPVALHLSLAATLLVMPWMFWIFALAVFEDGFRPGRWHFVVLAAKIGLAIVSHYGSPGYDLFALGSNTEDLLRLFPNTVFSFALVFHVMIIAWKGRTNDLVELRIDLRRIFALLMGVIIAWFMLSFLVLRPLGFGRPVDLANALMIGLVALGFLSSSVRLRHGLFPELDAEDPSTAPDPGWKPDPELVQAILRAFEEEHIYRTESLTIGQLARHLSVQEYRLRRTINGQMGFRNFNDLLNRYRIQDACELLATGELPIIRVATEVGYPSPAPFNRAFRQIAGITPTEFRRAGHRKA